MFLTLKTHKIGFSRYIPFHENLFPYHFDYDANMQNSNISLLISTNDCCLDDIDVNNKLLLYKNNIAHQTVHTNGDSDITLQ